MIFDGFDGVDMTFAVFWPPISDAILPRSAISVESPSPLVEREGSKETALLVDCSTEVLLDPLPTQRKRAIADCHRGEVRSGRGIKREWGSESSGG